MTAPSPSEESHWRQALVEANHALAFGDHAAAVTALGRAARGMRDHPAAQRKIGTQLIQLGDYDGAIACFHHAQMEQSDNPQEWAAYTQALWVEGQRDPEDIRTLDALIRLETLVPDAPAVVQLGRMVRLSKNQFEEIIAQWEAQARSGDTQPEPAAVSLARLLRAGQDCHAFQFDGQPFTMALTAVTTQTIETSLMFVQNRLNEPDELRFVRDWVGQADHIAEIGCLLGNHSAFFLRTLAPKSLTLFEADPLILPHLKRTIALNTPEHTTIRILEGFVGKTPGRVSFAGQQVEQRTLDDGLAGQPLDFIKIDVDGAEEDLLDGAAQVLGRTKPKVMIEVTPETEPGCMTRLQALGLRLVHKIDHGNYANLFAEEP